MAVQRFRITPEHGDPYEVDAGTRDLLVWEKTNKAGRTQVDLAKGASIADLYGIAFQAAKRLELSDLTRAQFEETCEVEVVGEQDEPDPTRAAR